MTQWSRIDATLIANIVPMLMYLPHYCIMRQIQGQPQRTWSNNHRFRSRKHGHVTVLHADHRFLHANEWLCLESLQDVDDNDKYHNRSEAWYARSNLLVENLHLEKKKISYMHVLTHESERKTRTCLCWIENEKWENSRLFSFFLLHFLFILLLSHFLSATVNFVVI